MSTEEDRQIEAALAAIRDCVEAAGRERDELLARIALLEARPATLAWTTEPPKVAGLYLRWHEHATWPDDEFFTPETAAGLEGDDCMWYGPLPYPWPDEPLKRNAQASDRGGEG